MEITVFEKNNSHRFIDKVTLNNKKLLFSLIDAI